jgi:hypothetical protein
MLADDPYWVMASKFVFAIYSRPTLFGFFFLFSLVRHHAPTVSQIEVHSSKHIIGHLSSVMPALIGPLSAFVSTVEHHGGSSPRRSIDTHPFAHVLL